MLGEVDDGGTPAPGTSTCMSALALEEELVERDDPERVSLPTSLFIILQNSAKQQNSWNGIQNKSQRLAIMS
jgi:hypothetical protein